MINYELLLIINPTVDDAEKEATVETVKGIIETDGQVSEVDIWGMKKLAGIRIRDALRDDPPVRASSPDSIRRRRADFYRRLADVPGGDRRPRPSA